MPTPQPFQPNWASAPGDTIADILRERRISLEVFAQQLEERVDHATELLEGRVPITIGMARKLERVLGASVQFWMARDFQYREDVTRQASMNQNWLRDLPLEEMVKFGWLKGAQRPEEQLAACLRFFDVPSVAAWRRQVARLESAFSYRTSPTFESRPGSLAAWLRQGEIEASRIDCKNWDPHRFRAVLNDVRGITREKDPRKFVPKLRELCASAGVALAIVRSPSGCRASGAVRLIRQDKALLLLSFRYLVDDHFWFSFFHEAGHLVLHSGREIILDGTTPGNTAQEREANDFAENVLIPAEHQPAFSRLPLDSREIIRFALTAGIAPGIVVGQLQHRGRLNHNQLNSLKRRFKWGND